MSSIKNYALVLGLLVGAFLVALIETTKEIAKDIKLKMITSA
jgi:hypothetical protein